MHRTCTNTSFEPGWGKWLAGHEKQWRRILSTSLPWTEMKKIEQVRGLSVPNPYHCATDASSLDGDIWSTLHRPAWKRNQNIMKHNKNKSAPKYRIEVLHLYRWSTHRHTPHRSRADEMKMKVRWQWKWNEIYLTRTQRGERKRRGTERTPTQHTWPGTGKPWKGKEKEKRKPTDNGTRPVDGGEGRKRLNQPNTAKTYAYLGTRRTQPTWRREGTHEIKDQWGAS